MLLSEKVFTAKEFIDDKTAIEALALINTMKLSKEGDYLRFISAVNLLNSFSFILSPHK